jgi:hypothetical protein
VHLTCQDYFVGEREREVNYEDLYFSLRQINDHLLGEYENPSLIPCIAYLADKLLITRRDFDCLIGVACDYICDVIRIELGKVPARDDHIECLCDALRDQGTERCDIITLNNDTIIERVLTSRGIRSIDGFGEPDGDVAWWDPGLFYDAGKCILLKLHGSVDWYRYDRRLAKYIGTDPARDPDHAVRANGSGLGWSDRGPLLIGTFNKILEYHREPHATLFCTFRRQLEDYSHLVISGYSFGDKAINTVLEEWMRTTSDARIVVLHEDRAALLANARGAAQRLFHENAGRITEHPHWLCHVGWPELRRLCNRA